MIGSIGKLPYAGMTYYWWHHIRGLQELGYDVHYLERIDRPLDAYDPERKEMTDDPSYALAYLVGRSAELGLSPERISFVDLDGTCHLSGWRSLRRNADARDVRPQRLRPHVVRRARAVRAAALRRRRPMFTQVAMASGEGSRADPPRHYNTLFSYATRIGTEGSVRPRRRWHVDPGPARRRDEPLGSSSGAADAPVVASMHWAAGREL